MENKAFWKNDDMMRRGVLAKTGAGSLGSAIAGSCGLCPANSVVGVSGLHKTLSMPIMGPHGPCGRRVGDDLGTSECGSEPDVPAARRVPHFGGDLEQRLRFLESTVQGSSIGGRGLVSSGGRTTPASSTASRGLVSSASRPCSSLAPPPSSAGRWGVSTAGSGRRSVRSGRSLLEDPAYRRPGLHFM